MYKTIYFYKLDIKKCMQFGNQYKCDSYFSELDYFELFDKVFKHTRIRRNTEEDGTIYLSCLIGDSYVVDILDHEESYLFGTIGCTKTENKLRRLRNKHDLSHKQLILDPNSTLEDYTYFYMDYSTGIISVINSKGAPDIKYLNRLLAINANLDPKIFAIKNNDVERALDRIVDLEGISLQFALPPTSLLGTNGERASMEILNQFKQDGFERCEIRFHLSSKNPIRKRPKEIIEHVKETYKLVNNQENKETAKIEKLDVIATTEEEKQRVMNVLELNFTKGVNLQIDENFNESSIKEQLFLVYNRIKHELLENVQLHINPRGG